MDEFIKALISDIDFLTDMVKNCDKHIDELWKQSNLLPPDYLRERMDFWKTRRAEFNDEIVHDKELLSEVEHKKIEES